MDDDLKLGIKRVRSGEKAFFALVLKGHTEGALIVSKKRIPPRRVQELKHEMAGSAVVQGVCEGGNDDGTVVFMTKKPYHNWIHLVKRVIKKQTGLSVAPEFRLLGEGEQAEPEGAT